MKALNQDLGVVQLAQRLTEGGWDGAVESILAFCRRTVDAWVRAEGDVQSVQDLEELVCRHLDLQIEEFRQDAELAAVVRNHVGQGDVVFASLPALFDDETFATLIRRRDGVAGNGPRYVAVIDGRGPKAHRMWFSRWHEIAHLLTLNAPTEAQPVHRSTSGLSGVERLMDLIAADLGFFEPLFEPVFKKEITACGRLDFAGVDRVRSRHTREASLQATTIACLKRWPKPAVLIDAGLALTAVESRQFDEETIPARRPQPKLRVLKAVGNEAAREVGLQRVRNMRVPESSVLHRAFFSLEPITPGTTWLEAEDLGQWQRSSGTRLPSCPVKVEARSGRRHIEALIQVL